MRAPEIKMSINPKHGGVVVLEAQDFGRGATWRLSFQDGVNKSFLTDDELQELNRITGAALMSRGIESVWVKA